MHYAYAFVKIASLDCFLSLIERKKFVSHRAKMATIEIQLKAYAKIIGTDRNCQVDLKRSVFQIDRDVNEIKIPLQAIVKLRKPLPSAPQAVSSSILPAPQTAQMSLPVISKIIPREELNLQEDPNMQAMVSTFNIPITVGNERKMVKTTLRYKKAPKPVVTEIETQTEAKQDVLSDLYPQDPVARALMLHQDRLQPVKQALREIKTKISNLRLEQKTTRYTSGQGNEYFYGTDSSSCPFIQYLMKQDQDGRIDMNTPISKIVGQDYFLAFEREKEAESQLPRPSTMRPSIRISTVGPLEKRDSEESEESGGTQSKSSKSVKSANSANEENGTKGLLDVPK